MNGTLIVPDVEPDERPTLSWSALEILFVASAICGAASLIAGVMLWLFDLL